MPAARRRPHGAPRVACRVRLGVLPSARCLLAALRPRGPPSMPPEDSRLGRCAWQKVPRDSNPRPPLPSPGPRPLRYSADVWESVHFTPFGVSWPAEGSGGCLAVPCPLTPCLDDSRELLCLATPARCLLGVFGCAAPARPPLGVYRKPSGVLPVQPVGSQEVAAPARSARWLSGGGGSCPVSPLTPKRHRGSGWPAMTPERFLSQPPSRPPLDLFPAIPHRRLS